MKLELEQTLTSKYPAIFGQYGGDPSETPMAFGIECGDGWYDIIDTLCKFIDDEIEFLNFNYECSFRCEVEQIKEKYGTLRFYVHFFYGENLDDLNTKRVDMTMNIIHGAIAMAGKMSAKTCESCGAKSTLSNDIFPKNECDACATLRTDALSNRNQTHESL